MSRLSQSRQKKRRGNRFWVTSVLHLCNSIPLDVYQNGWVFVADMQNELMKIRDCCQKQHISWQAPNPGPSPNKHVLRWAALTCTVYLGCTVTCSMGCFGISRVPTRARLE
ncbi:uncharacterized [Tachysurus ichikawai]